MLYSDESFCIILVLVMITYEKLLNVKSCYNRSELKCSGIMLILKLLDKYCQKTSKEGSRLHENALLHDLKPLFEAF